MGKAPFLSMSPIFAIFVAGVLTGVAVEVVARLTPDAIASARHILSRIRASRH